jgi:PAS domain S-box-containing protein
MGTGKTQTILRAISGSLALIVIPTMALIGIEIYNVAEIAPDLREAQELVVQTLKTISTAQALDETMQDAERAQRSYLITGEEERLDIYRKAAADAPKRLADLRQLTADNPEQQKRIAMLATQLNIELGDLEGGIEVRRQGGFEAARAVVQTNIGLNAMREITGLLGFAIQTEGRLLAERQQRLAEGRRNRVQANVGAIALALLTMVLGCALLARATVRSRRAHAALQDSEARFRLLIEGITDYGIFMLDPDGHVASWNPSAERTTGYSAAEAVGIPVARLYTEEDRRAGIPEQGLATAREVGKHEAEGWRVRKDGTQFWANAAINAIHNASGELVGFAKITRDATERRQRQEEQEKAQAVLAHSQKMQAIGHLTGGVAHDFNNLLTAILGSIELLERQFGRIEPSRALQLLAGAKRASEQAAALTQRLLAFSRRQALSPQIVDVNKQVSAMSELLRRVLGERVAVETVLAGGLWRSRVDPNQLESALLNLAVNARDAMPEGGKLTIETGNTLLDEDYARSHAEVTPGQYVMIAVSDTGSGMSEETIAQAFEPFFTTKPEGEGTGLGLSQVYGFVKQSGGHVALYSELAQGTTVKIYLPRAVQARALDRAAPWQAAAAGAGGETILLVEDDPDVREFTVEALIYLGYRVLEASHGQEALRLLDAHPEIALLFTDVGLPGLNGRQLATEAQRRLPHLKVLFTTGYARNAIVHHGILDSGVELLAKPFTTEGLSRKLQQVLRGAPESAGTV